MLPMGFKRWLGNLDLGTFQGPQLPYCREFYWSCRSRWLLVGILHDFTIYYILLVPVQSLGSVRIGHQARWLEGAWNNPCKGSLKRRRNKLINTYPIFMHYSKWFRVWRWSLDVLIRPVFFCTNSPILISVGHVVFFRTLGFHGVPALHPDPLGYYAFQRNEPENLEDFSKSQIRGNPTPRRKILQENGEINEKII